MSWKEGLNEDIKESPAFKDIGDDINDLAKNYLDAQSHLGNAIRIPSAEATPEDVTAFHTRLQEKVPGLIPTPTSENQETIDMFLTALGKPKSADDYKLPEVDGVEIDDTRAALMKKTAHEVGMTGKQLDGFLTKMYEADMDLSAVQQNGVQEDQLGLKKEWGVTHENRIKALTDNLLLSEAPEALTNALKSNSLDSGTIKWLDTIFSKFSSEEGEFRKQPKDPSADGLEPSEAAERAKEIRAKMTATGMVPSGPEYAALQARLLKYERMAHPESSTDINDLRVGVRSG